MNAEEFQQAWKDRLADWHIADKLKTQLRAMVLESALRSDSKDTTELSEEQSLTNKCIQDYLDEYCPSTASVFNSEAHVTADRADIVSLMRHSLPGITRDRPVLLQIISDYQARSSGRVHDGVQTDAAPSLQETLRQLELGSPASYPNRALDRAEIEREVRDKLYAEFERRKEADVQAAKEDGARTERNNMRDLHRRELEQLRRDFNFKLEDLEADNRKLRDRLDRERREAQQDFEGLKQSLAQRESAVEKDLERLRVLEQSIKRKGMDIDDDRRRMEVDYDDRVRRAAMTLTESLNSQLDTARQKLAEVEKDRYKMELERDSLRSQLEILKSTVTANSQRPMPERAPIPVSPQRRSVSRTPPSPIAHSSATSLVPTTAGSTATSSSSSGSAGSGRSTVVSEVGVISGSESARSEAYSTPSTQQSRRSNISGLTQYTDDFESIVDETMEILSD
ncbi:hypothetical protein J8273_3802 [Carpediemonas membranifera]|uniref:Uncharacterized protein n=1 Tax=Carpediemonas membranifera TaxID=201153 RepID=A0A8J6E045_9EUKA|nr:hypothetical protein J8273_3802 [Carpediemonas membranifera]|eukprot:KAG9394554.1 hypothetical protein J8273_3802 [Carpediemonas membranifera]